MRKYLPLYFSAFLTASITPGAVNAGADSGLGTIAEVRIGSSMDYARFKFSRPIKNPERCTKADFYMVEVGGAAGSDRFISKYLFQNQSLSS